MTTYLGTATGSTPGVQGDSTTSTANGVKGTQTTTASAVYGSSTGQGAATHGYNSNTTAGFGLYGQSDAPTTNGYGVYAKNTSSGYGVYAWSGTGSMAIGAAGGDYGVWATGKCGVYGKATTANGYGVLGEDGGQTGAYGGYFTGNVKVTGSLTVTGTKSFLIDHPLDPAHRYLEHACIESPEMKNMYDGVGMADDEGVLEVLLPTYFEALNTALRYQLTALGGPAPNLHIREEVHAGTFVVAGAAPGQKICWQVTGIRKDAYAVQNPVQVERDKPAHEKGLYLQPEVHGAPKEAAIGYAETKAAAERHAEAAAAGDRITIP